MFNENKAYKQKKFTLIDVMLKKLIVFLFPNVRFECNIRRIVKLIKVFVGCYV